MRHQHNFERSKKQLPSFKFIEFERRRSLYCFLFSLVFLSFKTQIHSTDASTLHVAPGTKIFTDDPSDDVIFIEQDPHAEIYIISNSVVSKLEESIDSKTICIDLKKRRPKKTSKTAAYKKAKKNADPKSGQPNQKKVIVSKGSLRKFLMNNKSSSSAVICNFNSAKDSSSVMGTSASGLKLLFSWLPGHRSTVGLTACLSVSIFQTIRPPPNLLTKFRQWHIAVCR